MGLSAGGLRIALPSLLLACADVRIEPAAGSGEGGAPPMPTGGGAGMTGAPRGGAEAGGNDGGEAGPVPGCEVLAWTDLVSLPLSNPRSVLLAPLDAGKTNLVYVDENADGTAHRLSSRVIEGAFESWPPVAIGQPAVHVEAASSLGSRSLTSRSDGTFALVDDAPGIFRAGEPGVVLVNETFTYPFVQPNGDAAYFVERPLEGPLRFSKRASLDPLGAAQDLGEMPLPDFCSTPHAELSDTPTFLFASRDDCDDGSGDAWAQFYQPGPTQIQIASVMPLPFFPSHQMLARRPGGYFYAISAQFQTVVYRLTPATTPIGEPIVFKSDALEAEKLVLWGGGFALAARTPDAVALRVSNGEQLTSSALSLQSTAASFGGLVLLAGGTGDRSVLIAVPQVDHIALVRADCGASR